MRSCPPTPRSGHEVLSTDAALRAERIACRLRHIIYAATPIKKEEYLTSAAVMQGVEIQEEDGIIEIKLPCLLPKRKQRQSTEFLLDPFTAALAQFAKSHAMPRSTRSQRRWPSLPRATPCRACVTVLSASPMCIAKTCPSKGYGTMTTWS